MIDPSVADIHHVLDLLTSSMDWGSGFMCDEDIEAWNRVAEASGYPKRAVKNTARSRTYGTGTSDLYFDLVDASEVDQ